MGTTYAADLDKLLAAAARIEGKAHKTPVITCQTLDAMAGRSLYFKCELFQKVGAFKFRGACNAVSKLDDATAARVSGRLLTINDDEPTRRQIVVDCLAKLRHRARERERLRVLRRIREAEAVGNLDAVAEGQRQLLALRQSEASE